MPRHTAHVTLKQDARNRAARTFVVGFAIDVGVAIALVLAAAFSKAGSWGELQWSLLGFTVAKTFVTSGCSYLLRMRIDPKAGKAKRRGLRAKLLPPKPVPEPAD